MISAVLATIVAVSSVEAAKSHGRFRVDADMITKQPHSSLSCVSPNGGSLATAYPCGAPNDANTWIFNITNVYRSAGLFTFASNPSLCLGLGPTSPMSGATLAALVQCDPTDPTQTWAISTISFQPCEIYNGLNGKVLEIYDNQVVNGTPVEIWPSNGGSNQQWTFKNNQLISSLSGSPNGDLCVTIC